MNEGSRHRPWLDLLAILALAAAVLVACRPLGSTNRVLAGVDAFTYFTPYWSYRIDAFRQGFIPLWNPYLFSGAPFLANIQTAVLYPLHWPLGWLGAEEALVWSALLHVWLAAVFTYILARRTLKVGRLAAFAAGLVFGLGGFTLARVENINQLNALAWLPALLWLYAETIDGRRRVVAFVGLTFAIALQLLAGHTQTTFINMVGLGLWALASAGRPFTRTWLLRLLPLLAVLPALALSAAQLLPTLELNALGLRTGGLDFRSAVSFSLRPRLLAQSLLPPVRSDLAVAFGSEGYAEFVGYIGITGLLLAGTGAFAGWRRRGEGRRLALPPLVLVAAGLLLALGAYNPLYYVLWRFVPGFDLFRAPARWLELFAMGAALLAALGLESLPEMRTARFSRPSRTWVKVALVAAAVVAAGLLALQQFPAWPTVVAWALALAAAVGLALLAGRAGRAGRRARAGLVALLFVELALGAAGLPFRAATAPMATGLRNATAALLAAAGDVTPAARDRLLSLSDIRYDPGDLAELRALQSDRLPAPAVERLVRAAKQVEVLAPNLPLLFRLPAVDGYDGGLLPLHRYVLLEGLFLDKDQMTPDGRLAEQLDEIPDGRLLDLTGVRYVITDKQRDLWSGDIYYDLEQRAVIAPGQTLDFDLQGYPAFEATGMGVVAASPAPSAPVTVTVTMQGGSQRALTLRPGDSPGDSPPAPQVLSFDAGTPVRVALANGSPQPLTLFGISLIDGRSGAHQSVTVSPRGDFRRIHSGDVKIYERLDAPGRAWLTHGVVPVADEDEAAAAVADPRFNPRAATVVEAPVAAAPPAPAGGGETVSVVRYEAERVVYDVESESAGLLVMADAWYPGWRATVDGAPAQILRANLLYRAIALQPGRSRVELTYEPSTWATGRIISLATLAVLLLVLIGDASRRRFTRFSRVTL